MFRTHCNPFLHPLSLCSFSVSPSHGALPKDLGPQELENIIHSNCPRHAWNAVGATWQSVILVIPCQGCDSCLLEPCREDPLVWQCGIWQSPLLSSGRAPSLGPSHQVGSYA